MTRFRAGLATQPCVSSVKDLTTNSTYTDFEDGIRVECSETLDVPSHGEATQLGGTCAAGTD